jgi:AcrR family transcriptional regulator
MTFLSYEGRASRMRVEIPCDGAKRNHRVNERKEEIARIAIKLFLKKGVSQTSMRALAEAIGMTTGGLYHYFQSKNEIIDLVVEIGVRSVDELKKYRESLGNVSPSEAVRESIKYWLKRGDERQDYLIFYTRETLMIEPSRLRAIMQAVWDFIQFFEGLLQDGIKAGEFEVASPTLVSFNIWALQGEWALRRWLLRDLFTIEEYAEKQADAIMRQILVDRGQGVCNLQD